MRLTDLRTGQRAEIQSTRRGLLRVCVHLSARGGSLGFGDLRALLVADVLARTAETEGAQVVLVHAAGGLTEERAKAWARDTGPLGIHPPAEHADTRDPRAALGGPVDVHLVADSAEAWKAADEPLFTTGPVHASGIDRLPQADAPEPLAVRLALLGQAHQRAADLDPAVLADAQTLLDRWRRLVATWADAPSLPLHIEAVRRAFAAFHDDLDTATALTVLRELESDPGVPDGARFESFLRVDRVLGLELPRDIGRQHAW
ncbi:hypothetical protein [Streptantibioticus ferralitis]|uniref:Cysteinyl-tRNA synthetase n=1 Tax=Streptantibioticus ferralitis TaxID=236510 RepID=A0ABT5YU00_9ACTN|nr:hypothetical protein [Streptantibioticus ferralitis]MDF2254968.1 hypothetical protein [Streptantibioticus ferralitis]